MDVTRSGRVEIVSLKDAPQVKRIICAAFPLYRKHSACVCTFPENGYSVSRYRIDKYPQELALVELATLRHMRLTFPARANRFDLRASGLTEVLDMDGVGNVTLKVLPARCALLKVGMYRSKPAIAEVYLNPVDFGIILPRAGRAS